MTNNSFSIASFNVHWGGVTTAGAPYDLLDAVRALDADVVVLQEAWWPLGDEDALHHGLRDDGYTLVDHRLDHGLRRGRHRFDTEHTGDWGILIASRLPVTVLPSLSVGTVPGDPILEREVAHLELDCIGTTVDLIAPHLSAVPMVGPITQLRRLRPQLPMARPTIIAGDLNISPHIARAVLGWHWRPAVTGFTWPAGRRWCQIDHIFTSGSARASDGHVHARNGSDHHPIRAVITID
ncbi:MAG: endonuclease/exonuclease/phosphatase family protein [Acidimicrobiia bacterium]